MQRRRLLWQLYPSYLLVTLSAIVGISWFASATLERLFLDQLRDDLRMRAQVVESFLGPNIDVAHAADICRVAQQVGESTETRISVVLPDGTVLCDSRSPAPYGNHRDRPEVQQALTDGFGWSRRISSTMDEELLYVAIRVDRSGKPAAVVRAAVPVALVSDEVRAIRWQIATGGTVIAVLAAISVLFVSRRITQPVESLQLSAERFAHGELTHRVPVPNNAEMARLAVTLNTMAQQLQERIRTLARQGNEQEAVLASMVEGVLAVDTEQRVISINEAAAELVDSQPLEAVGRSLQEVIRNSDLRKFVSEALAASQPIEADIVLHGPAQRVLQGHGTALRDQSGHGIGAVIVLNDVTELRRLESMRSDFVANVSHELRTPITSIKGFVETLLDGALDERSDAERFLRIIAKQADRLNSIIEDLLSLSKIEQRENEDLPLEEAELSDVIDAALADCETLAAERRIELISDCEANLVARVNAPLLEQALVNLLDNAVKYSDEGQRVEVQTRRDNGQVVIRVRDHGCGIPVQDQSRIFERFYRVDKGRSRKLGGTGLGLSIVKHIMAVHRGSVEVHSEVGHGSTFTIRLPV